MIVCSSGARLAIAAFLLVACDSGSSRAPEPTPDSLADGALAQVGPLSVTREQFALWSDDQRPPIEALVRDALLSLESTRVAPHRAQVIERAAHSRALLEQLREDTLSRAPPTQQEVAQIKQRQWLRFDRPRAVRTAVVRVPVPNMTDDTPFRALAEELHQAAREAHNIETWLQALSSVQTDLKYQKVRMPPVAADGRVVPTIPQDREMKRVDPSFASNVTQLKSAGELSSVFATPDAYQFAFATEIIDARPSDAGAKREELVKSVAAERLEPILARITEQSSKVAYSKKDLSAFLGLVWRE